MQFENFQGKYGPGIEYARPSAQELAAYRDRLPSELVEDWRENGWRSYVEDLIWFVNPSEFEEAVHDWFPGETNLLVFARTSFGDLLLCDAAGQVHFLHVHYGKHTHFKVPLWFYIDGSLQDERYLTDVLDLELHRQAVKTLGLIQPDEMFTFEPALALGGAAELAYVQKAQLSQQLNILSQLNTPMKDT